MNATSLRSQVLKQLKDCTCICFLSSELLFSKQCGSQYVAKGAQLTITDLRARRCFSIMCLCYCRIFQVADIGCLMFRFCPSPTEAFSSILTQFLTTFCWVGVHDMAIFYVSVWVVSKFFIAHVVITLKKYIIIHFQNYILLGTQFILL